MTLFRADSTPDLVASLHVFGEGPGWPDALNRLIVQASAMPQSGLVSRPSVLHALVTLWEREFEVASETAAIAELATHPSTSRLFADLLTPLALRGVGEFPMRSLRICQVRGDPGRFFVIAQLPSAVVRDAYLASSFRRDEVLPTIGPYLAADVRRYSLTPLWHSGRPGAG